MTINKLRCFAITVATLGLPAMAAAQNGHYLEVYGGPQLTNIANLSDNASSFQGAVLNRTNTFKYAGGINYIYNWHPYYGFQTGLSWSQQGQKYSGTVATDGNYAGDTSSNAPRNVAFNSEVQTTYFKLPMLFRFNSDVSEGERVNMTMYAGFTVSVLGSVDKVTATPTPPQNRLDAHKDFDFKRMYNPVDFCLTFGGAVNFKTSSKSFLSLGIKFDRSLTDIESGEFNGRFPEDFPMEYSYPLSTKKERYNSISRNASKYNVFLLSIGFTYKIANGGRELTEPGNFPDGPLDPDTDGDMDGGAFELNDLPTDPGEVPIVAPEVVPVEK